MAKGVGRVRSAGRGMLSRFICLMTKLFHVEQSTPVDFQELVTDLLRQSPFRNHKEVQNHDRLTLRRNPTLAKSARVGHPPSPRNRRTHVCGHWSRSLNRSHSETIVKDRWSTTSLHPKIRACCSLLGHDLPMKRYLFADAKSTWELGFAEATVSAFAEPWKFKLERISSPCSAENMSIPMFTWSKSFAVQLAFMMPVGE